MTAYTQAQLDALRKAIASGAREVEYNDSHRVKFHSLAEMERLERKMAAVVTGKKRKRRSVARFSNGY